VIVGEDKIADCADRILISIREDGEDSLAEIADVMLIVGVSFGSVDDDGAESQSVFYRCSSAKGWVQRGLLEDARRAVDNNARPVEESE
jgi:hypothetical protein